MAKDEDKFAGLALRPLEALLNRGIGQSATAQGLARELDGRAVDIRIDGTPVHVRLRVQQGAISTSTGDEAPVDASISGTPLGLARLLGPREQEAIRQGFVRFTGDADLAERFRKLLLYARPDLEEELSRLVGDPLAHEFGRFVTGLSDWSAQALGSFSRSLSEYLQEESRLVPPKRELATFASDVDALVDDVARAEAILRDLQARLRHGGSPAPR